MKIECIVCHEEISLGSRNYHYTKIGPVHDACQPCKPKKQYKKIASHSWYHGTWERDTCECGNGILVPQGKKGIYRCNDCADRAEGFGE